MAEELFNYEKPEVDELTELLLAHENREIKSFYPGLDEYLSKKEKDEIFKRTKEIKIGFVNKDK